LTSNEWEEEERVIVRAWSRGDSATALAHIQRVLEIGTAEQRGRALIYRGSMHEDARDWLNARDDFIQAAGLLPPGSYARYTAELSVGHVCELNGARQEALAWHRAALLTCSRSIEPFSGASAARSLMSLEPEIQTADRQLLRDVLAKSWRVLHLDGEPDLDDLSGTTDLLTRAGSRPR
jgi:hypothetical protein